MSPKHTPKDNGPKKPGFLDSMFDINRDGKVDSWDFAEMAFIQDMIDEEEEQERLEELGVDPDGYELDDPDDPDA